MGKYLRQLALVIIDISLVVLSARLALWLRFDGNINLKYMQAFKQLAPILAFLCITFFILFKLYNRFWKYAGLDEMFAIVKASTLAMMSLMVLINFLDLATWPRSVYILTWVFINVLIGGSRMTWRIVRQLLWRNKERSTGKKVLLVGAGDAGALLLREIHNNRALNYQVLGFLDDDKNKKGNILSGISVLGQIDEVAYWSKKLEIDEIIITIPSASGEELRHIVEKCAETTAQVKILPGFYPGAETDLIKSLREVEMDDLLRRKPIKVDLKGISDYITGEVVLITGAGGSIGSELCRQILALKPKFVIMLDNCENNLFDIEMELKKVDVESRVIPYLADVREQDKLEKVFKIYNPGVVFHAAAYKHVPMMERHPQEAIHNNVIGTGNVARLAAEYKVDTFILVSTDKAVNPTSIMGATKRIAELVINDIARNSTTKFAAVRFGNVLGSRGSVIPIFKEQILQGGEIFVLDMGQMIKIDDLARDLIRLSGYEPDKDIKITYTGMRPGEKLYEELFTDKESMKQTRHERIFISHSVSYMNPAELHDKLVRLVTQADEEQTIKEYIKSIIPEYKGI